MNTVFSFETPSRPLPKVNYLQDHALFMNLRATKPKALSVKLFMLFIHIFITLLSTIAIASAVETPSMHVSTGLDIVDESDNIISLREAMLVYSDTTIYPDLYEKSKGTVTFDGGLTCQLDAIIIYNKLYPITLDGATGNIIIQRNESSSSNFGLFELTTPQKVTYRNLSFTKGIAERGGAIYAVANDVKDALVLNIDSCLFSYNTSTGVNNNLTPIVKNMGGGAISLLGADGMARIQATIKNSSFNENKTSADSKPNFFFSASGGSIYISAIDAVISNCVFTNSTASHGGGAICGRDKCKVNIINSKFINNKSSYRGGAILAFDNSDTSLIILDSCLVKNNRVIPSGTNLGGGGVWGGTIRNSIIQDNEIGSGAGGGAMFAYIYKSKILSNKISTNTSAGTLVGGGTFGCDIDYSLIANNIVEDKTSYSPLVGGGGCCAYRFIRNSIVVNNEYKVEKNKSASGGGGIYQVGAVAMNSDEINGAGNFNFSLDTEKCIGVINSVIANNKITSALLDSTNINFQGTGVRGYKGFNSIIWGNELEGYAKSSTQYTYSGPYYNNAIFDANVANNINLTAENMNLYGPKFKKPTTFAGNGDLDSILVADWSILPSSICIDKGLNTYVTGDSDIYYNSPDSIRQYPALLTDYAGKNRINATLDINKPIVDIGAFENYDIIYIAFFKSNGGSNVDSQFLLNNELVSKPIDPIRAGHLFGGWYLDDALFTNPWNFTDSKMPAHNITLYAKWTSSFTVTFVSNGGSSVASQSVIEDEYVALPTNPIRDSFIFSGWFLDDSIFKNTWIFSDSHVKSDITLFARWISEKAVIADIHLHGVPTLSWNEAKLNSYELRTHAPEEIKNFTYFIVPADFATIKDNKIQFNRPGSGLLSVVSQQTENYKEGFDSQIVMVMREMDEIDWSDILALFNNTHYDIHNVTTPTRIQIKSRYGQQIKLSSSNASILYIEESALTPFTYDIYIKGTGSVTITGVTQSNTNYIGTTSYCHLTIRSEPSPGDSIWWNGTHDCIEWDNKMHRLDVDSPRLYNGELAHYKILYSNGCEEIYEGANHTIISDTYPTHVGKYKVSFRNLNSKIKLRALDTELLIYSKTINRDDMIVEGLNQYYAGLGIPVKDLNIDFPGVNIMPDTMTPILGRDYDIAFFDNKDPNRDSTIIPSGVGNYSVCIKMRGTDNRFIKNLNYYGIHNYEMQIVDSDQNPYASHTIPVQIATEYMENKITWDSKRSEQSFKIVVRALDRLPADGQTIYINTLWSYAGNTFDVATEKAVIFNGKDSEQTVYLTIKHPTITQSASRYLRIELDQFGPVNLNNNTMLYAVDSRRHNVTVSYDGKDSDFIPLDIKRDRAGFIKKYTPARGTQPVSIGFWLPEGVNYNTLNFTLSFPKGLKPVTLISNKGNFTEISSTLTHSKYTYSALISGYHEFTLQLPETLDAYTMTKSFNFTLNKAICTVNAKSIAVKKGLTTHRIDMINDNPLVDCLTASFICEDQTNSKHCRYIAMFGTDSILNNLLIDSSISLDLSDRIRMTDGWSKGSVSEQEKNIRTLYLSLGDNGDQSEIITDRGARIKVLSGRIFGYYINENLIEKGYYDTVKCFINQANGGRSQVTLHIYVGKPSTYGSEVDVHAKEFNLSSFVKSPTIYAAYFKPYTKYVNGKMPKATKFALKSVSKTNKQTPKTNVNFVVKKRIDLANLRLLGKDKKNFHLDIFNSDSRINSYQYTKLGYAISGKLNSNKITTFADSIGAKITVLPKVDTFYYGVATTGGSKTFPLFYIKGKHFGSAPKAYAQYINNKGKLITKKGIPLYAKKGGTMNVVMDEFGTIIELPQQSLPDYNGEMVFKFSKELFPSSLLKNVTSPDKKFPRLDIIINSGSGSAGISGVMYKGHFVE